MPAIALRSLIQEAKARDARNFARELGPLVLVGPPPNAPATPDGPGGWRYLTADGSAPLAHNPLGQLLESVAHPLRRAPGRSAEGAILVGRAASNDVCVDDPSISKLHARIELGPDGAVLRDAGSHNGTFYDGVRLSADRAVRLAPTHSVRFGDVELKVYDPKRLHAMLSAFRVRLGA